MRRIEFLGWLMGRRRRVAIWRVVPKRTDAGPRGGLWSERERAAFAEAAGRIEA